jgi:FixJ family two-component response regulator
MSTPLVAIIDDDDSIRKALTRLLASAGAKAVSFASAAAFLERRPDRLPDCLVLDVHLGGMSGFELLSRLHADQQFFPTIIITAQDDQATRDQATRAGCVGYMRKPLDAANFLQEVFAIMHRQLPN